MGGKGSGRKPSEKSIINSLKPRAEIKQPIATDMFLPNHSGIATHPEAKGAFGHWTAGAGNDIYTTNTSANVGIGLTNPNYPLHVYRSTGGSLVFQSDASQDAAIAYLAGSAAWVHGIYGTDSNKFKLKYLTTDVLTASTDRVVSVIGDLEVADTSGTSSVFIRSPTNPSTVYTQFAQSDASAVLRNFGSLPLELKPADGKVYIDQTGVTNHLIIRNSSGVDTIDIYDNGMSMDSNQINDVADPTLDQDAATKKYVDDNDHDSVTLAGTPDYITISGQVITRNTIDISDDTNLVAGTNITLSGDTLNVDDAFIKNDADDTSTGKITAANFAVTADNNTNDSEYVPMVLHGTDATPPTASGFPRGTIYIQYDA